MGPKLKWKMHDFNSLQSLLTHLICSKQNSRSTTKIVVFRSVVSDSCDPMDYSLPGSSVHRIFQARILEWVAISFSRGSSWPRDQTQVSHIVGRCFTLWARDTDIFHAKMGTVKDRNGMDLTKAEDVKKRWQEYTERKKEKSLSCIWLFATPWTAASQAPPSMGFSRQEYWSGLPFRRTIQKRFSWPR